jgi:hypothetical protein
MNQKTLSLSGRNAIIIIIYSRAAIKEKKKKIKRSWTSFKGGGAFFFCPSTNGEATNQNRIVIGRLCVQHAL